MDGTQTRAVMVVVDLPTRCTCGEDLRSGERAGRLATEPGLLCLWCLADLQAGRRRPRRRRVVTSWPKPATPQHPTRQPARARPAGGRRASAKVTVALVLLLLGAVLYVRPMIFGAPEGSVVVAGVPIPGSDVLNSSTLTPLSGGDPQDTTSIWPATPADARSKPIGAPPPKQSSSTDFAFMSTIPGAGGKPVSWDPCRPIHMVVNDAQAPAKADQLLREATQSVSAATGLQFVIDGPTTEPPSSQRSPLDKSRYGDQWSPVLVAWTDPSMAPELSGAVAGVAGPAGAPYYTPAQQHWVSGTVSLDGPQFRELIQQADGLIAARAIVMHELGHLVGLNHVSTRDQLMYKQNVDQQDFGAGDREGLRQLGLGPCFTNS